MKNSKTKKALSNIRIENPIVSNSEIRIDTKLLIKHIQRSQFFLIGTMLALLILITSTDIVGPAESEVNKFNKLLSSKSSSWIDDSIKNKAGEIKKILGGYKIIPDGFSVDNPSGQILQPNYLEGKVKSCDGDVLYLLHEDAPGLLGAGPRRILPLDSPPSDIRHLFGWVETFSRSQILSTLTVSDWEAFWRFLGDESQYEVVTDVDFILAPSYEGVVKVWKRGSSGEGKFKLLSQVEREKTIGKANIGDQAGRLWWLSPIDYGISGADIKNHRLIYASPLETKNGIDFTKGLVFGCKYEIIKVDLLSVLLNKDTSFQDRSFYAYFPNLKQYDERNEPVSKIDFGKERLEQENKKSIKLFVDLEGRQVWVWAPLIELGIYFYLFLHMIYLAEDLNKREFKKALPPVSLFYPGKIFGFVSFVSVAILPPIIFMATIYKSYTTIWFYFLSFIFLILSIWMGFLLIEVRKKIKRIW